MANQFDKVLNQVVDAVADKVGSNVVPVLKVLADHTELLEEVENGINRAYLENDFENFLAYLERWMKAYDFALSKIQK
jgi:hypothetical protein